ncbi:ArsA family ATPase [bacterium]|nr:ArsA family ATPase [bacterium]
MKSSESKLLFFGGKGGVGKTTCSAAVAVKLASEGNRTLHITSDMAPSLGVIYHREIGDKLTAIAPNLNAVEISPDSIARTWKEKFGPDFAEILSHLLDMDGMEQEGDLDLLDYIGTAPSLREETLLDMIVDMAGEGKYQRIIWDTAPAGETLNLLHMPRLMRKHLKAGAKIYEAVDRLAGVVSGKRSLADIMEEWTIRSEGIVRFLKANTMFFVVANPEALVVKQTERIMTSLVDSGFSVNGIIINRIAESDGSKFLQRTQENQSPYMMRLMDLANGLAVGRVFLTLDEIRGLEPLRSIGSSLAEELGLL